MTPADFAAIMLRLDHQDEQLREIRSEVKETKQHAAATNGRVTQLEVWRGYITGAVAALGAVTGIAVPVAIALF